jgi:hypothetical protein
MGGKYPKTLASPWRNFVHQPRDKGAWFGSSRNLILCLRSTAGGGEMAYDTAPPKNLPEPEYYYHFKHDPDGPLNNYAYYIYGVGHHTEDDCRTEDAFMQVYRPLYEEAYAYRHRGLFDLRPLQI